MRPGIGGADVAAPLAADAGALYALKQQARTTPKAAV